MSNNIISEIKLNFEKEFDYEQNLKFMDKGNTL